MLGDYDSQYAEAFQMGLMAPERHAAYLTDRLSRFASLRKTRPWVMLGGHSRCGKDEAAKALRTLGFRFTASLSRTALPMIALDRGEPEESCYESRHQAQPWWRGWLDGLRESDPTLLLKLALVENDILVGVRSRRELLAGKAVGLFDWSYWIDRDVPEDLTLEYRAEDCDAVLCNYGNDLAAWHQSVVAMHQSRPLWLEHHHRPEELM